MATCPLYISKINPAENIGDSLLKLNNNFYNLKEELCLIKDKLDKTVKVRTFFYYGPNIANDPTSGMNNGTASRPSNTTIENFVNRPDSLNLPIYSQKNDLVYVIYQKTGFYQNSVTRTTSGTVQTARVIGFQTTVAWSTTTPERFDTYSPVFIIWLLNYDGNKYTVMNEYPKFSQAQTLSSPNWNNPASWSQY